MFKKTTKQQCLLALLTFVWCLCIALPLPIGYANVIATIERDLENKRMARLAQVRVGAQIKPFVSDGCSGGMSAGWKYLASKLPLFSHHFGRKTPWHACCVAHDRAYWRGDTQHGFAQRLQADRSLKICVEQTGLSLAPQLSKKFQLGVGEINLSFRIAAQIIYRAVRLGGGPCTLFAWRWGFGWPACN